MLLKMLLDVISSDTEIKIYNDMCFIDNNLLYEGKCIDFVDTKLMLKKVFQILAYKRTIIIILD